MENGCHTCEQALILGKGFDGSPCSLEHTVVEDGLMSHRNGMQAMWHGEYDMEVFGRDNLFPAEFNPLFALFVLTLGTMPVTAAVIADMHVAAFGTHLDMSSEGTGPAQGHVCKGSCDRCYDMMLPEELLSMTPDNLSDVETGSHLDLGGKMVSIKRTCFCGSMSAT